MAQCGLGFDQIRSGDDEPCDALARSLVDLHCPILDHRIGWQHGWEDGWQAAEHQHCRGSSSAHRWRG